MSAAARRRRSPVADEFAWRHGVCVPAVGLWLDAVRRHHHGFVSSAGLPWTRRYGAEDDSKLVGTPSTLALLAAVRAAKGERSRALGGHGAGGGAGGAGEDGGAGVGRASAGELNAGARGGDAVTLLPPGGLAVPLRRRFTLGTWQLELVPSGAGFGAAALYLRSADKQLLYVRRPRLEANVFGEACELRAVDAMCIDTGAMAPNGSIGSSDDASPQLRGVGEGAAPIGEQIAPATYCWRSAAAAWAQAIAAKLAGAGAASGRAGFVTMLCPDHASLVEVAAMLATVGVASEPAPALRTWRDAAERAGGAGLWPRVEAPTATVRLAIATGGSRHSAGIATSAGAASSASPVIATAPALHRLGELSTTECQELLRRAQPARLYLAGAHAAAVALVMQSLPKAPEIRLLAPPQQMSLFGHAA